MSTPIRVGGILDYPRPASSAKVTGSHMQDSSALLEQLLQVARISALEEMASGIAHELNQPIGAITTFAQAGQRMLERPEPMIGPAAEVLRHISNEALNAGEGIRRIRSLFHGHHAERTGCNLADVIAELLPILELLAGRSGATLQFSSQSALPAVAIDRLRIQHVLFTLVQNALEAPTRNGDAPRVRIDVSGDRYGVRVTVEDSGVGNSGRGSRAAVPSVLHDQGPRHRPGARIEPRNRRIARGLAGCRERRGRRHALLSAPAR